MNTSLLVPVNNWKNSQSRYGRVSVALHWLMLLILIAVYASIELRELYPRGSQVREAFKAWHFALGLSVLALAFLRIAVIFTGLFPRVQPALTVLQRRFTIGTHSALYLFMVFAPLLGWLALSVQGKEVSSFAASWAKPLHEAVGNLGYVLIGLHAAWALYQHYMRRNNALLNMLPKRD